MRFPYVKFPFKDPKRRWVSRPLILIRLFGPKGVWEGYGLIDSGADRCLFNSEIAKDIGLNLSESRTENFSGIEGGNIKAKLHQIKLQIVNLEEKIEVVAGFVESKAVSAILGQEDFFDSFKIKFERDHGIIEITSAISRTN